MKLKCVLLMLSVLVPFNTALADWRLMSDGGKTFIATDSVGASVGFRCQSGEPLLILSMVGSFTAIRGYVDKEPIRTVDGNAIRIATDITAYVLSPEGVQQLKAENDIVLRGIKLLGDDIYRAASLIGFSRAYDNAGMTCGLKDTSFLTYSETPSWEAWEHENAIGKPGSFVVIDQPEQPFCYVKQSYYDDTDQLELIRIKGKTQLVVPYPQGVIGDLIYWVDSGPKRTVPPLRSGIHLDEAVFSEMKAGNTLYVQVQPKGQGTRIQELRLNGFTTAVELLKNPACND